MNSDGYRRSSIILYLIVGMLIGSLFTCEAKADEWTAGEVTAYATVIGDYLQTRQIRKHDNIEESIAFYCGRNPSELCTLSWFALQARVVWWMNNAAPGRNLRFSNGIKSKHVGNGVMIGLHLYAIDRGIKLGLSFGW